VCETSEFVRVHRSIREGYQCKHCRSSLRYRGQAEALLKFIGKSKAGCLVDLAADAEFRRLEIFGWMRKL